MTQLSRRGFVLSVVAASAGCAMRTRGLSASEAPAAAVRLPLVGQSWRYARYDLVSGAFVDIQVDRVAAVGSNVDIDSHSESGKDADFARKSWGTQLLGKFRGSEASNVALTKEIQDPWGMVLVDPHWDRAQVYERPIPLWPAQIQPGWRARFRTQYKTLASDSALPWEQTMQAQRWETISSPAGQFRTLRFTNVINFTHPDPGRANSMRRETMWFAPEIGRWVARESLGTYYLDDSIDDTPRNESAYRWQLLEWT